MDPLADILAQSRVGGSILLRGRLHGLWAFRFEPVDHAVFYVVEKGTCWLSGPDGDQRRLVQGDIVLLPHGTGHIVSDIPDRPPMASTCLTEDCDPGAEAEVVYGEGGAETVILGGAYWLEPDSAHPLVSQLPEAIHIEASVAEASSGLQTVIRLLAAEARQQRSGYHAVVDRLVDVLFVYVLRSWLEAQPEGTSGWLAALRDPQVGKAVSLLHRELARGWTVASLAHEVGMSRAAFAREFARRTGEPPLAYLTRRRMEAAARLLRGSDETLASIAGRVGYESEFAFAKAFKRIVGVPPGRYRSEPRAAA